MWTVVADNDPERLMPIIRHVRSMAPGQFFTDKTSHDFDVVAHRLRLPWTAHSFKRGAVTLLVEAASEGKVDQWIVARLAKHKTSLMDFPETTLRYTANDPATARMLGTQHATLLL
jgi:hypothetical protein